MLLAVSYTSLGTETVGTGTRIVAGNGYRYDITAEDALWLGRSLEFEGGSPAATAWTYAQRMAALRWRGSLASLVQAHSQPVNPKWRRTGVCCAPDGTVAGSCPSRGPGPQSGSWYGTDYCSESRLAKRDRNMSTPLSALKAATRRTLEAFLNAELPNPVPGATDFADERVTSGFLRRNPGSFVVLRAGNWYVGTAASARWPADFVKVESAGRVAMAESSGMTGTAVLATVAVAAAGAFAYWAWKKSHHG
jgi:hypothetical protein